MQLSRSLLEHHTWYSVFSRPAHSRMKRTQRLTVCATTLLAYMGAASFWYTVLRPSVTKHPHSMASDVAIVGMLIPLGFFPIGIILYILYSFSKLKVTLSMTQEI